MKNKNNKKFFTWILKIMLVAFIISLVFSLMSETIIPNVNFVIGIFITIIFIVIGVVFDMIGLAVASADISIFNSMAAKKVKGSKIGMKLIKNADKVSSFCNDVIGDICGIISGSTGAVIVMKITESTHLNSLIVTIITMAIISTLTIGGKALEKNMAINNSTSILLRFSKILSFFIKE